jgi:hypothetical protein
MIHIFVILVLLCMVSIFNNVNYILFMFVVLCNLVEIHISIWRVNTGKK